MRMYKWIIGILSLGFIILAFQNVETQYPLEDKYMRFHVVANSDSSEDQELKLKVRDRLLSEFKETFEDVESVDEAENRIRAELKRLEEVANDEIRSQGKDYDVKATVGFFDFPIKAYGSLVLPAGKYHALKVVIGEGEGANWWCVMFPPLCFVDISHGVAMDVEDMAAHDVEEDMDDHIIEYRLKSKEWLNSSFPRMVKLFSLIPGI